MLLHGDIFLNENTELRVGVSYGNRGVIIHSFFSNNLIQKKDGLEWLQRLDYEFCNNNTTCYNSIEGPNIERTKGA